MVRRARSTASARSPWLYAGWPQQVWLRGTSTTQPASSSCCTAAKPIDGRNRSIRQVTKSATRGLLSDMGDFSSWRATLADRSLLAQMGGAAEERGSADRDQRL